VRDDLRDDEILLRQAVQNWAEAQLRTGSHVSEDCMRVATKAGPVIVTIAPCATAEGADDAEVRFSNLELRP
jgi:hypothetical protein